MEKDFNPWYHTEYDLVENCNIEYTAEAIKVSLGSIIKLTDYIITHVDEVSDIEFQAYPNPTSGELMVSFEKFESAMPVNYKVIDLQGRQLISGELFYDQQNRISLNRLPDGMYILSIQSSSTLPSQVIIIKRG
jgi:hypothetical protein